MAKYKILRTILHFFKLDSELDNFDEIHESIEKSVIFRGTNLWILIFAIIVASVGLNVNSTAVIIGAMLISPLMGPINGMGYSIATYNFPLFKSALKNFGFAVFASLIASTTYFAISPVSTAHSELLARTSPTIYDVLIALFGGLAGIVAMASRNKGNVIPGVAIATALMPPLCTAGYGIATAQMNYFFGAMYLFAINTVFIAFAAAAVSQMLNFPIRTPIENSKKRYINRWITVVIIITVIPSIYFGVLLVKKEKFLENANRFVNAISVYEGNYMLKNEINPTNHTIKLVYAGNNLSDEHKRQIKERAKDFMLEDIILIFQQAFNYEDFSEQDNEISELRTEIHRLYSAINEKNQFIDSLTRPKTIGLQLYKEITSLFPEVNECIYSESLVYFDKPPLAKNIALISIKTDNQLSAEDREKIIKWLQSRLQRNDIKVVFEI